MLPLKRSLSFISVCVFIGCTDVGPVDRPISDIHCCAQRNFSLFPDYDSLLFRLKQRQSGICAAPTDSLLRKLLVDDALDTQRCTFSVVGISTADSNLPYDAKLHKLKNDAQQDAFRWSLYLKAWYWGKDVRYGTKIFGTVSYSRILTEQIREDTLLQLIQIPIHSIVFE